MKSALGSFVSRLCIAATCLLVAIATVPAHADGIPAFSFSWADFRIDDHDTAELGYTFTTGNAPITVAALGYINDGYNATHTITIFNVATQQAVTGASATVTTIGGNDDSNTFTYTNLASLITLEANTEYQIVSQFFTNEYYYTQGQAFTSHPGLTFGHAVYGDYGAPPAFPDFATGSYPPNNPGDFGPNFTIVNATPVPELSSLYLVASGLFGLGATHLRRRKR
jgi:hypothetical protein